MDSLALLVDFGSTFTKVTAVDLRKSEIVGRSQAPSSVLTDVCEGLLKALAALHERHGLFAHQPKDLDVLKDKVVLASSSAAGGLRMVVIGLVPGLTVEAANQAALGAGAKVVGSTAFKLREQTIENIEGMKPDILLLTGGADGGDSATILHNARCLARWERPVPVVVAGNAAVAEEVCGILRDSGKTVRRARNVMPRAGELSVESAREEVRKLFMERIAQAKGLDQISELTHVICPTPMAVLEGARRGSQGSETEKGWGDLLVVDVGGATTDVHSIGNGNPSGPDTIVQSLPESFAKRTVEGDLGIRYNATTLLERVGAEGLEMELHDAFPEFTVSRGQVERYIEEISRETARIPEEEWHGALDAVLARLAVDVAIERHVGKRERIFSREGELSVCYGKDLSETSILIGTGGIFLYNPHAAQIFASRPNGNGRVESLRPKNPKVFIDSSYILYAVGLLSERYPDVAVRIFGAHMRFVA